MEKFKIDNFNKEMPDGNFPNYITLDSESCADIRALLSSKLGFDVIADGITLVNKVSKLGKDCEEFSSKDEGFNLKDVMSSLGIELPNYIFINWYRYDSIDKMMFSDFENHFDDIWYPDVDDIDVFDETLAWVLTVTHYGHVKVLII